MVDLNDPETKKEIDAYIEHEKHEPLEESAEDLGNRFPLWVWTLAAITVLGGFAALAKACL